MTLPLVAEGQSERQPRRLAAAEQIEQGYLD